MKRSFYENSISVLHDSIFIAITSSEIGWVPLWCKECSHKCNLSTIPTWWVSVLFSDTLLENRHPAAKRLDKICDLAFLFVCFCLNWGLCQHIRFRPASNYYHNQNTIYYLLFHHFVRYCQINALMHLFMLGFVYSPKMNDVLIWPQGLSMLFCCSQWRANTFENIDVYLICNWLGLAHLVLGRVALAPQFLTQTLIQYKHTHIIYKETRETIF